VRILAPLQILLAIAASPKNIRFFIQPHNPCSRLATRALCCG
jgi:hypothetical protein